MNPFPPYALYLITYCTYERYYASTYKLGLKLWRSVHGGSRYALQLLSQQQTGFLNCAQCVRFAKYFDCLMSNMRTRVFSNLLRRADLSEHC